MANARKRARQRRRAQSLIDSMRDFLTPAVFRQVRNALPRRKSPRWDLHPLLYILLLTTYCCGDSLPERFEAARGFYVACCPKRKRPGECFSGFEKAMAKLPMPVLRALAAAIRRRVEAVFHDRWKVGDFIPFGCDGTRQACPRTEELEKRLGTFGKEGSSPKIWNTAATFYSEAHEPLEEFREGIVYYWPKAQQSEGKPPIRGRLMRIHSAHHKVDVWLFTNVEDRKRLPLEMAGTCYRWRWENEGFFRTYKRTLKKVVLTSRTLRRVHREAEASMIATQLLLCQGALAMPAPRAGSLPVMCSPRRLLLEARRDISSRQEPKEPFGERITRAQRERRERTSAKQKREWPRRKTHKPPHPPILLRLTQQHKNKIHEHLQATKA